MLHPSNFNDHAGRAYNWVAQHTLVALFALIFVTVLFLFPGIYGLPPVDRTEVVFAQIARQMLETLNFAEARFQDTLILDRPFGTLWIQSSFAWLSGAPDAIASYRMASATFTIAGICLLFFLSRSLYGGMTALWAALWLAGAPLIILQGHLALSKPLLLPCLVIAQLSLAHVYAGSKSSPGLMTSLFWLAQVLAAIIGGLAIATLSFVTIIALIIWDRSAARFKSLVMHPAALAWLAVVAAWSYSHIIYFAGNAEKAEDFWASIGALIEPQHMHLTAPPGAFILLLMAGVLPMLVVLFSAIDLIRQQLSDRKIKFLLAWIAPYILVLELFSTKPPTYMVQSVIPAIALLSALVMARIAADRSSLKGQAHQWWLAGWLLTSLIQPFAFLGFAWLGGLQINFLSIAVAFAMSFLFAGSVLALHRNFIYLFALLSSLAGLAIYPLLFSQVLPSYKSGWVSPQLKDALSQLQACAAQPVAVLSYTEPSIVFLLGTKTDLTASPEAAREALVEQKRFVVVDSRQSGRFNQHLSAQNGVRQLPIACISGINYARAEDVTLEVYIPSQNRDQASCQALQQYMCTPQRQR